jgi:thiol-disulfide isomerase/thioredoxin
MKTTLRSCAALVAVFFLALAGVRAADAAKPAVIGLLFHADWCASCKTLAPKLDVAKKDFAGQPVLFARLDLTDDATRQQAALHAAALGASDAYSKNAPKTGFMLLLDGSTGRELARLTKVQTEAELRATIAQAVAAATRR